MGVNLEEEEPTYSHEICPKCKGKGFINATENHPPIKGFKPDCYYCAGTGVIKLKENSGRHNDR